MSVGCCLMILVVRCSLSIFHWFLCLGLALSCCRSSAVRCQFVFLSVFVSCSLVDASCLSFVVYCL